MATMCLEDTIWRWLGLKHGIDWAKAIYIALLALWLLAMICVMAFFIGKAFNLC